MTLRCSWFHQLLESVRLFFCQILDVSNPLLKNILSTLIFFLFLKLEYHVFCDCATRFLWLFSLFLKIYFLLVVHPG